MHKINYSQLNSKDKYDFFRSTLNVSELLKEEYFGENIGLRGYRRDYEKFGKKEDDTYIILKQEVENLLEKYDLEDMRKCIKAFNFDTFSYGIPWHGQFWEYLYWRVFHDDENFKPELMRHKIEELEEINFGFATYEK